MIFLASVMRTYNEAAIMFICLVVFIMPPLFPVSKIFIYCCEYPVQGALPVSLPTDLTEEEHHFCHIIVFDEHCILESS